MKNNICLRYTKKALVITLFMGLIFIPRVVTAQSSVSTEYTYDALGRLNVVRENGTVVEGYEYDQAGNRCKISSVAPSANGCSQVGSTFTSIWNYGSTNSAASFQTSDSAFQLVWSSANPNGLVELREYQFRHRLPSGSTSNSSLGLTYSKSVSSLGVGAHSFEIHSCGVLSYDENEYEVTGCTAWMKINVTVI